MVDAAGKACGVGDGQHIPQSGRKILLGEDDGLAAAALQSGLSAAGFLVSHEDNGHSIWQRAKHEAFDAIILDLGLPQVDGLTILRRWRRDGIHTPVMILSARSDWEERVEAIEAGADDYQIKPMHEREVIARMHALIRRTGAPTQIVQTLSFGPYELDRRTLEVRENGLSKALTPHEYRLIVLLLDRRGRIVSPREIAQQVLGRRCEKRFNAVEVLVARLRKRLGRDVIHTCRGEGYTLGSKF